MLDGDTLPSPVAQVAGELAALVADLFPSAQATPTRQDPLVLDLDGSGAIETVGLQLSEARFDHTQDGFSETTGWASAQDAFVARDLNDNGTIDTGRELFGDQTLLPNGTLATNGFQAIAALDSNADGKVDAQDAAWGELRV